MKTTKIALVAGLFATLSANDALASGNYTNGLPQAGQQYPGTLPLTGAELAPFDTQLPSGQQPQSEAISTGQLAGLALQRQLPANYLIGGDFGTNLWQRGVTSSSITSTYAYTADRWFAWSGTSTAFTVAKDSTAANVATGSQSGAKIQRTAAQTGVVPIAFSQIVETSSAVQLAGKNVELQWSAITGANFSAANGYGAVYVTYGTGTDEGAQKLAYGLNAGGGGASAWTGQTNALAVTNVAYSTTLQKFVANVAIPSTATEIAVTFVYTPVGTAGTNDWVELSQIALVPSSIQATSTAAIGSSSAGYGTGNSIYAQNGTNYQGTVQLASLVPPTAYLFRPAALEAALQQRYYYQVNETVSGTTVLGQVEATSSTAGIGTVVLPVTMRTTPTVACTFGTLKVNLAGTPTALTACGASAGQSTPNTAVITTTVASGQTAGQMMLLQSGNSTAGGIVSASAEE